MLFKDKQIKRGSVKSPIDHAGSTWTWTAVDRDTKLVLAWVIGGDRSEELASVLVQDLDSRIVGHPKITSDGLPSYIQPMLRLVRERGAEYVQLVKDYGQPDHIDNPNVVRYKGAKKEPVSLGVTDMSGFNTIVAAVPVWAYWSVPTPE